MTLEASAFSSSFKIFNEETVDYIKETHIIQPVIHGYDFTGMYNDDVVIDMKNQVIYAYMFDDKMNFAGFSIKHAETGITQVVIPKDVDWNSLTTSLVEEKIVSGYEHTRLVGFRTSL